METRTHYVGGVEAVWSAEQNTWQLRRYIGGVVIATFFEATDLTRERYLHTDHLGSITAISDETGQVVTWMGFDPWGQRRNADAWHPWTAPPAAYLQTMLSITPQGFTGHEHVDTMGIIHMGGRIYDPVLGRFLQADPFVEDATTLNRYSYVLNNPLSLNDPSGFFFSSLFSRSNLRLAAVIGISVFTGGLAATTFGGKAIFGLSLSSVHAGLGVAVGGGFLAGYIGSGGIEGALFGAFTAATFFGIGQGFHQIAGPRGSGFLGSRFTPTQFAALSITHGMAGGTLSAMQGGRFGHGFLSAGITKVASQGIADNIENNFAQTFAAAMLGGSVSSLTGGKFANGAQTAAMAFAFNQQATESRSEATEDSLSASVTAKLHERLRAGITVNQDGALVVFRLPVGEEFSLTVNQDGAGRITVGSQVLTVNDRGLVDGSGVNIRGVSLMGRALDSGDVQFTGRVSIPLFANRVNLSLGRTRSINIESAFLNNSGLLGEAARGLNNRTRRLDRAICEQSASGEC